MTRPAAFLRSLGGGATGMWRRLTTALARAWPARFSRRSSAIWLAVAGVCSAMLVLAWIVVDPGERHDGTVELDVPQLQPARRASPGDAPPQPAPARSDRIAEARPNSTNTLSVPAATAAAFATIPLSPRDVALAAAPDPALTEMTDAGALPRRADDGRVPWQAYGRPFAAPNNDPRIAVIITGLGSSPIATNELIRRLPGAVTLAFEARVDGVGEMARAARKAGHEILLGLPVQDDAFPFVDRGPDALTPGLPPSENRARLERLLGRISGYVGVITDAHGKAGGGARSGVGDPLALASEDAAARGLLFVGSGPDSEASARSTSGLSVPWVRPDLVIGIDDQRRGRR